MQKNKNSFEMQLSFFTLLYTLCDHRQHRYELFNTAKMIAILRTGTNCGDMLLAHPRKKWYDIGRGGEGVRIALLKKLQHE